MSREYVYLIVYFDYISVKFQRLLQDVRLKALFKSCFKNRKIEQNQSS